MKNLAPKPKYKFQFSHKTKMILSVYAIILWTAFAICATLYVDSYLNTYTFRWQSPIIIQFPLVQTPKVITPLPKTAAKKKKVSMVDEAFAQVKTYPVAQDTSEQVETRKYIEQVFGSDADTAFQLLSCENHSLNRDAVNTAGNSPVGSRDIGVFQVNEFWQKVQGKFLFNWKTNIEIAHDIFVANGNFQVWTCGRTLGI